MDISKKNDSFLGKEMKQAHHIDALVFVNQ